MLGSTSSRAPYALGSPYIAMYLPYISPHLVARAVRAGQPVLGQQALLLLLLAEPRLHRGDIGRYREI